MRKPNFSLEIFLLTRCHSDINELKRLLINFSLTKDICKKIWKMNPLSRIPLKGALVLRT